MIEELRREVSKSIRWVCRKLEINRLTYYRKALGFGRSQKRSKTYHMNLTSILREAAEADPTLGYRRVWAKARRIGYSKSKVTVT